MAQKTNQVKHFSFDFNGTLADTFPFRHLAPADPTVDTNWNFWAVSSARSCRPITRFCDLLITLSKQGSKCHVVTSRSDHEREALYDCLKRFGLMSYIESISMRNKGDCRKDEFIKVGLLNELEAAYDMELNQHFEDNPAAIDMLTQNGFNVYDVQTWKSE